MLRRCPPDQLSLAAEYILLKRSLGSDYQFWKHKSVSTLPAFVKRGLLKIAADPRIVVRSFEGLADGVPELSAVTDEVWRDLCRLQSSDFAKVLRRCIKDKNGVIRCEAAECLAWLAFDADADLLVKAATRESRVAEGLFQGFKLAHGSKRPSTKFTKLINSFARRVVTGSIHASVRYELSDAIDVIRITDPTNANKFLSSAACLHLKNPLLWNVLVRFEIDRDNGKRSPLLEPTLLWSLYESVATRLSDGKAHHYGESEGLLGLLLVEGVRSDPVRAQAEIKIAQTHAQQESNSSLRAYVAIAKRMLKGAPNPQSVLARAERRMKQLSRKAQAVLHARSFGECLYNDSFESYLDSCGDHWKLACEGLQELGLANYARTLKYCYAAFEDRVADADLWSFIKHLPPALRRDVKNVDRNGHRIMNAALEYAGRHPEVFS